MAKRRYRTKTRYRTIYRTARRSYSRLGSKTLFDGIIAGVGGSILEKMIGSWGSPIATIGVGYFRKNNTLKTIGSYQIGDTIGDMISGIIPGVGGSTSGGLFE